MFSQTLKKVVDNVDGGLAAVIMGLDGIAVDTYTRINDRVDINTVAMEFYPSGDPVGTLRAAKAFARAAG